MTHYWYKNFVTQRHRYVLLDSGGDIRASSPDLEGIIIARAAFGWGTVHPIVFRGRTIKIGRKVRVD